VCVKLRRHVSSLFTHLLSSALKKKNSAMPKENALLASSTVEAGSALRVPTVDATATMPRLRPRGARPIQMFEI